MRCYANAVMPLSAIKSIVKPTYKIMEKSLKTLVTFLLLVVLGSILSYFVNPTLYHEIIKEDGIIEYLTALLITGIFYLLKS